MQTTMFMTGGRPPSADMRPGTVWRSAGATERKVKPAKPRPQPQPRVPGRPRPSGYLRVAEPAKTAGLIGRPARRAWARPARRV
jgi:hypothetical protein